MESASKRAEPKATISKIHDEAAQVDVLLAEKRASLCGLQRLHRALVETQEMVGVRGCIGESWFRPNWERLAHTF